MKNYFSSTLLFVHTCITTLLINTFILTGCTGSTTGSMASLISTDLAFKEASLTLVMGDTFDIATLISGGVAPYTYSIPTSQGLFTGSIYTAPYTPGVYIITVYDANTPTPNSINLSVSVNSVLTLLPAIATMNSGSQLSFAASGGVPPYTYSLQSGGESISANGLYTAQATSGNTVILVTDSKGTTATASVTVQDALSALSISPPTASLIKNGTLTFTASGGSGPYTYSIVTGSGTVTSSNGLGQFVAPAAAETCKVRVTDSLGSTKDAIVTIYDGLTILPLSKSLTTNQIFTFSALGGVLPYSYSIYSGIGNIADAKTGAYSSSTAGAAVVRVTDAAGNTSDSTVSVSAVLVINPTSKTLGVNNSFTFSSTGGTPPYTYSLFSGTGTVNATSGNYTAPAASTSAVVRVTDAAEATADATVTVNSALSISPVNTTVAAGGTQSFTTTGGAGPYIYTLTSGGGSFSGATYTAPSIASGSTVAIVVTDSINNAANATITINPISVSISSPLVSDSITDSNKAAFPMNGTCSELTRSVVISASDGTHTPVTATVSCTSSNWSTSLNLSSLNDASITLTANHANINAVAAPTATVTISKLATTPTITISSPSPNSFVGNSVTVTGACTKVGPVTLSAGNGISASTTCSAGSYSSSLNLTTAADGPITITANHTDDTGNTATPATVNISKDTVAPTITAFTVTNSSPTTSATFNLTFTASGSPTQSCILENSTNVANCSWQGTPLPSSFLVTATYNAKVLSAWVKDAAGNVSAKVDSNSVTLNDAAVNTPLSIILSDPISSPGGDATPTFLVSGVKAGDSVSIYTSAACVAGYLKGTAVVGTGTTVYVTSSSLPDGTYTFYTKTVSSSNVASSCSSSSTSANPSAAYVLNTAAPTSPTISINNGAAYTKTIGVPLTLSATGATEMYITNTAGCNSNGGYEPYSTSVSSWFLATSNAINNVYVKFKSATGIETTCVSDSITHDSTKPSVVSNLSLGTVPTNLGRTPNISWTAATDNIGVAEYQVQLHLASDNSVVVAWTPLTSGNFISGASDMLVFNNQYYVVVRAIDGAGNIGDSVQSANWTATVPCTHGNASFTYTGAPQSLTIPIGCTAVTVKLWGAGGGGSGGSGSGAYKGGPGGYATGTLTLPATGETLQIIVGGGGSGGTSAPSAGYFAPGGYGGGGNGGTVLISPPSYPATGAGGGGRSAIIRASGEEVITAGGGGGAASYTPNAGAGGGTSGTPATASASALCGSIYTGLGGGPNSGGAAGYATSACGSSETPATSGSQYTGGTGAYHIYISTKGNTGGGGGGGWYGGGGGAYLKAGGGGSSYYGGSGMSAGSSTAGNSTNNTPGNNTDANYTSGVGVGGTNVGINGGNGKVYISY